MKVETIDYYREKYTSKRECSVDGVPDAHVVFFKIGNQQFSLDGYQDTAEEAEWFRQMLAIAFATLVQEGGHP